MVEAPQPLTTDMENIRAAQAELKALGPRLRERSRTFIRAASALVEATEEAWQISQWSGAGEHRKRMALDRYHRAKDAYYIAEGRFSAALGGGVHESELEPEVRAGQDTQT